jgi:excisionase family DNA binding protein
MQSIPWSQMIQGDTTPEGTGTTNEEDLLTVEQVQELLQTGRTFTYSLIRSGELPSYRVGRLLRVRRRDVNLWLEKNRCVAGK